MRLPYRFWTTYRCFLVRELLARQESRNVIAGKLGVTRAQLQSVIQHKDLKPRPLLERIAELGGDPGHMGVAANGH